MIPAIERLVANPPRPGQIGCMVFSPTRELAMQIMAETEKLLRFHSMEVQVVIGGTNMSSETSRLKAKTPQILVGTPVSTMTRTSVNTSVNISVNISVTISREDGLFHLVHLESSLSPSCAIHADRVELWITWRLALWLV